jgi:dimethylargininase
MLIAITRAVSPTLAECELTHRPRDPINVAAAVAEHAAYEETLRALGATIVRAPAAPTLPDAVFVEDTAIVVPEAAVLTRPGTPTRRGEVASMATTLGAYRPLRWIQAPGTLDGGDVLRLGRRLYVGLSTRSNREGIAQLGTLLAEWDYTVSAVVLQDCLHLKSAVTQISEHQLLVNPRYVRPDCFGAMDTVSVAPGEPDAANALLIAGAVVYPAHHRATAERLERADARVVRVPAAEIAKAEGGVTCCSVLVETASGN